MQVVLDESRSIVRHSGGVIICETRHGFICANAGVDASNVPGDDTVVLLPANPDASARALRARLRALTGRAPAVVITDSFGRAWRIGQCDVAIGCAGVEPVEDWRGRTDANGRVLRATLIAVADELAATADLARRKDGSQPAVVVRGAGRHVTRRRRPRSGGVDPCSGSRTCSGSGDGRAAGAVATTSAARISTTPPSCRALGDSPRITAPRTIEPTGCTVSSSDVIAAGRRGSEVVISSQPST